MNAALGSRLAACTVLAAISAAAWAEVVSNDLDQRYSISGTSEAGLRREMSAKGPLGADGRRYDAYTLWHISWRYNYRQDGALCRIGSITTKVEVTMTLPRWDGESAAQDGLRARWRKYFAALTEHENGHRVHGRDAAHEIDAAIARLPGQSNCVALGNAANSLGNQIIHKYNERDLDYDRRTDHGRTQGARFP